MLYQFDQTESTSDEVFGTFWTGQQAGEELRAFAEQLVLGVIARRQEMDQVIAACAENWRIDRMAVVDRNVLRLAAFEMIFDKATPHAVVIDEAIEISKKYGSEDSATFINGVLDAIRKRIENGTLPDKPQS
jgi:N utilization substance protein B